MEMLRAAAAWMQVSSPHETGPCIQAGMPEGRAVISLLRREMQFILSSCLFHARLKGGKPHQALHSPFARQKRDFLTWAVLSSP